MTDRKFTPPTEFPAKYATRDGKKAVIVAQTPAEDYPLIGWMEVENGKSFNAFWADNGVFCIDGGESARDLFDIVPEPQKQVRWANDYKWLTEPNWWRTRSQADTYADKDRVAVIRREWVEGQLPQYFAEEV
jgi:hypothetical protein